MTHGDRTTRAATPTQAAAQRMKELRVKRGLTAAQLAGRMTELGIPWDRSIVANLENGRRRSLSVDEMLGLAVALNVAPVHLLVPVDGDSEPYHITPAVATSRFRARAWIRGLSLPWRLPKVADSRQFYSEVPEEEFKAERVLVQRQKGGGDGTH